VYALVSPDSDIGVIMIDFLIGVKQLDVDIDVRIAAGDAMTSEQVS
jgi:hypothetical protein